MNKVYMCFYSKQHSNTDHRNYSLPRSIRRNALAKIAELSATSSGDFEGSDIERLCRVFPGHNKSSGRVNGVSNDFSGSLAGSPMVRRWDISSVTKC